MRIHIEKRYQSAKDATTKASEFCSQISFRPQKTVKLYDRLSALKTVVMLELLMFLTTDSDPLAAVMRVPQFVKMPIDKGVSTFHLSRPSPGIVSFGVGGT